jgi:hypothetical protein
MGTSLESGRARHPRRRVAAVVAIVCLVALVAGAVYLHQRDHYVPSGEARIVLVGEEHGKKSQYDEELRVWKSHYSSGSRDLFVELPYYTAQYLNLWMSANDDAILDQLWRDWDGTAAQNADYFELLRSIKRECPQTVFHGTDVGHQYQTTGERYLAYASKRYGADSEEVALARECVNQGIHYYEQTDCDDDYREGQMVANFERAYDALGTKSVVVGFYGAAHSDPRGKSFNGHVDSMANQLRQHYGDVVSYQFAGAIV